VFREKIKWRTGSEGGINHLKRSYGWNCTERTCVVGARTWYGHGVFAHNLVKIAAGGLNHQAQGPRPQHRQPRRTAARTPTTVIPTRGFQVE
jgi:hypothetical protein